MRTTTRSRMAMLVLGAATAFIATESAQANQWTISTYRLNNTPVMGSTAIADQYLAGTLPTRFSATGTVIRTDQWENGPSGQFLLDLPIPGLDQNVGVNDTNDFAVRVTGRLNVITAGNYDFFTDTDDGNRLRIDLNQNGTFEDATESVVPDGGFQGNGVPERSAVFTLAAGQYAYEFQWWEALGGAAGEMGYRKEGIATQFVVGDGAGGIATAGANSFRVVGANLSGNTSITNFAQADALKGGLNLLPGDPATGQLNVFNMNNDALAQSGDFGNDDAVPGVPANTEDFITVGTGFLVVTPAQANSYIFRSNTDDGGRLKLDLNQDGDFDDAGEVVINDDVLSGPHNVDTAAVTLAAGSYMIEYSFFERDGGAEGEVSARLASGGNFILLGDDADGGLNVVPEPATLSLLGLGALAMVRRRRI